MTHTCTSLNLLFICCLNLISGYLLDNKIIPFRNSVCAIFIHDCFVIFVPTTGAYWVKWNTICINNKFAETRRHERISDTRSTENFEFIMYLPQEENYPYVFVISYSYGRSYSRILPCNFKQSIMSIWFEYTLTIA